MTRPIALSAIAAMLFAGPAIAQDWRSGAVGTRSYIYTSTERAPGRPDHSYRMGFDLVSSPDRSVVAVVRHAAEGQGDEWADVVVDPACASAMHAGAGEIARVALWPMNEGAQRDLGAGFLAECAPPAIFFPMTDILNVVLVQAAPQFGLAALPAPGDARRTPAYSMRLDRLGFEISMSAEGGETRLAALDEQTAVVDWVSDPMNITLLQRGAHDGQDILLEGIERYSFQLEFDVATGALRSGRTTHDQLDLVVSVPGLSADQRPRVVITREVAIKPTL